jgi:MYXO-CTERM domain-containing protein
MRSFSIAVGSAVCAVSLGAHAQTYIAGDGTVAAKTYTAGTPLTLLIGATVDDVTITDTPADDMQYPLPNSGSHASYGFFSNNRTTDGFVVDTNGYVMPRPGNYGGSRGSCTGQFINTGVKSAGECRSHKLAAFWDDLLPVTALSRISYGATSGSFWYVQWNNFALYSNPAARVTFRLTYFKSPDRIRINYIAMSGTGANGSSATVGARSCAYPNGNGTEQDVEVSHNTGFIPLGSATVGTSLMAIEIDRDSDRDHLLAAEEATAGSSDGNRDSDGDTVTDFGEVVAGTNPNDSGSTPPLTDTDSDGMTNADETAFGTNAGAADSDSDGIDDGDELFTTGTDPSRGDSDGDGLLDGEEDLDADGVRDYADGESDPLDSMDYASLHLGVGVGDDLLAPQLTHDAAGNVHGVAVGYDNGLFYWMVKPNGSLGIGRSSLPTNGRTARHPTVAVRGTMVTIVYESLDRYPNDASNVAIGYVRLNIAGHPGDGSVTGKDATSLAASSMTSLGVTRYLDMALDSDGTAHVVYQTDAEPARDGNMSPRSVGYVKITSSGAAAGSRVLADYPWSGDRSGANGDYNPGMENNPLPWVSGRGVHKITEPRIAIDDDDVAHVFWRATVGNNQQDDGYGYQRYPSGLFYARIDNGNVKSPVYVAHGAFERHDVAYGNGMIYIATSNGEVMEDDGIRLAVLDPSAISFIPRVGDLLGANTALASSSFITPFTTVFIASDDVIGAGVTPLANGNVVITFSERSDDDFGLITVSPQGVLLSGGPVYVRGSGDDDYYGWRHKPVVPFGTGYAVAMANYGTDDLRFVRVPGARLPSPNPPVLNRRPTVTSTAPRGGVVVGDEFSYSAEAEDDNTSSDDLTWFLVAGPEGSTLSSSGRFRWTPVFGDEGDSLAGIAACDEEGACGEQWFVIAVGAAGSAPAEAVPPAITVEDGGCGCAQADPSALALLGVAALALLRRRHRA